MNQQIRDNHARRQTPIECLPGGKGQTVGKRLLNGLLVTYQKHSAMTLNNDHHELWNPCPSENQHPPNSEGFALSQGDTITQEEISELVRLQQQSEHYARYRKSIRRRLLDGAHVQPGSRSVQILEREYVSFSRRTLECAFGTEWVQQLGERLPPEIRREMLILDHGVPDPLGE